MSTADTPHTTKGQRFPAVPLTNDEVRRLLNTASNRSASGIRVRAIIAMLYGAGLRVSEALALYPRDVDTQQGIVRVHNGKGGKARTVGLDTAACALLDRWLDRRAALGLNGRHPLFALYTKGMLGKPVSTRYVRHTLSTMGKRAGIEKRVHPHGLRHSCAFALAQAGVPTHVIQAQLGHGSLATTDRYVRHLAPADVVAAMRRSGPMTGQ